MRHRVPTVEPKEVEVWEYAVLVTNSTDVFPPTPNYPLGGSIFVRPLQVCRFRDEDKCNDVRELFVETDSL